MTVTDQRDVEELEKALQAMKRAKNRNLYDHRAIRMGLSKNIRLHEQALKEPQAEKEDIQEDYQARDEEGRKIFIAADGRRVVETTEGEYFYAGTEEQYIQEADHEEEMQMAGAGGMSKAEFKQRSLRRAWEDVEEKEEALEDLNEREVGVDVFVLCGDLASIVVDPSVQANEEEFLYLFDDFREMMGLEISDSFEKTSESELERLRERQIQAEAPNGQAAEAS